METLKHVGDRNLITINIVEWVSYVAFDIIGDLGFGDIFHDLDNNALHPWVAELFSYSKVGAALAVLRHYTTIFKIIMRCLPAKSREAAQANYKWGVEKTHRRLDLDLQRDDCISQILRYGDNDDLRMSLPELENDMNFLIFAGAIPAQPFHPVR